MKVFSIRARSGLISYLVFVCFTLGGVAYADALGRLHVTVKDVDDEKPIAGATVVIHDSAKIKGDITLTTDQSGSVTSPTLENGSWVVSAVAPKFEKATQPVKVTPDGADNVELALEPEETTIKITSDRTLIKAGDTSSGTSRDQSFLETFPVSSRNSEQLTGLLVSNPGFVEDSANQVHPRGEHSDTSIYVQGYQLGGAAQGRFGPLIDPQVFENVDVMTGALAPEFAGEAAVLNTTVRSGTIEPEGHLELGGGNFKTAEGAFTYGGQAGPAVGAPDKNGNYSKEFSYFLSASGRTSDNALEAPQPDDQTAHNNGNAGSFLGKFDFNPTASDSFSVILNASPAKTQIANRAGLPSEYAPYGQGYGFGGALSAAQAASQGIPSQEADGQDIYQVNKNSFGVLQWHHQYYEQWSSLLSFGMDQSILNTMNQNPEVNLNALPEDNSIEYNPTVKQDARHMQTSGSVTYAIDVHTFKAGAQYVDERADSSYQLIPASQLAANDLFAIDSRLVPFGTPEVDADGNAILDANGNQVYSINPGATSPTLSVKTRGFSEAAYLQDTWKMFKGFTSNYGVRFDSFHQHENLGDPGIDKHQFSPRVNLSYNFYPTWIARAAYNKLFIEPPLSQGSIIGESIKPESVNQYETSIEKQITARQTAKVAYYYKDIKNQVDTGLLIPSTQLGLYTSVNFDRDAVHGTEVSYELFPDAGFGSSAYVAYAWSKATPGGFDNTGAPAPKYNDHDQRSTLSTGAAYTFTNKAVIGVDGYYGSGVESSRLAEDLPRKWREHVDISVSSPPDLLFGRAGLKLTATNIFDDRSRINFNSGFSGTRFQQGTAVLLSTFLTF